MSGRLFLDGDLKLLKDKTIAVIGYGNQGRAQARILKELNGMNVIVGNIRDRGWDQAVSDGFKVYEIAEAAGLADVIMLLVPDEVAPEVYSKEILPSIEKKEFCIIDFASGYNITYGYIRPASNSDIILVAPRMIGAGILDVVMVKGKGYPVLLGVHQDVSGKAWDYALSLAKGIGAFLPGGVAVKSSFEEETLIDLFSEQFLAPSVIASMVASFEVLTEEYGVSPEAALLELYASGEWSEVFQAIAEKGFFKQLRYHSRTSQFGQLTNARKMYSDPELKEKIRETLNKIYDGSFAKEWAIEQTLGNPVFNRLWKIFEECRMSRAEEALYRILKRIE